MRLSADKLIDAALRLVPLEDFGGDEFREPLEVLVGSYNDCELSPMGTLVARAEILRALTNRLRIEWERTSSEMRFDESNLSKSAIVIVGLQRSGTTFLHRLLTCDTASRPLPTWEALYPAVGPMTGTDDWRRAAARHRLEQFAARAGGLGTVHELDLDAAEECVLLFDNTFASISFEISHAVPGYSEWLRFHERAPDYDFYGRQLSILSFNDRRDRWLLKGTNHLTGLRELVRVLPSCRLVYIHREPKDSLPSFCNLVARIRSGLGDVVEPRALGDELAARWMSTLEAANEARQDNQIDDVCLDIAYSELVVDPVRTAEMIYSHFGFELTRASKAAMSRYLSINGNAPPSRSGAASDWGISDQTLRSLRSIA